jgi:hypothetical protein
MDRRNLPHEIIATRYRFLVSLLMWACSLSHTEAVCCIRMYLDGHLFGSEAVDHMGGNIECIRHAVAARDQFAHMGITDTYRSILHRADYYAEAA